LHREKFRVLVVEKQTFPRFVIGESMLPISMDLAGTRACSTPCERNFMRKNGAVFLRGDETCNFDFSASSPPAGNTLSRCRAPISTRRSPTPWPRAAWKCATGTA
jgi:hypothetical protein